MVGNGVTIAQLEQVDMCYGAGEPVLRDVDLLLTGGSFRFLLGPSGSGKTSLLRLLRLGAAPTRGRLRLLGEEPIRLDRDGRARLRQRIGIVFQDVRLLDGLSAFDNVALRLRVAGADESTIPDQVLPLLDWLGLGEVIELKPPALTPAQRQLTALARAAIGCPSLVVADEPLTGLDPGQALLAMRLLFSLQRLGAAVVVATRNEALQRRYGLPALRLVRGRLLAPAEAALAGVA